MTDKNGNEPRAEGGAAAAADLVAALRRLYAPLSPASHERALVELAASLDPRQWTGAALSSRHKGLLDVAFTMATRITGDAEAIRIAAEDYFGANLWGPATPSRAWPPGSPSSPINLVLVDQRIRAGNDLNLAKKQIKALQDRCAELEHELGRRGGR